MLGDAKFEMLGVPLFVSRGVVFPNPSTVLLYSYLLDVYTVAFSLLSAYCNFKNLNPRKLRRMSKQSDSIYVNVPPLLYILDLSLPPSLSSDVDLSYTGLTELCKLTNTLRARSRSTSCRRNSSRSPIQCGWHTTRNARYACSSFILRLK